jgi:hypothetical protein
LSHAVAHDVGLAVLVSLLLTVSLPLNPAFAGSGVIFAVVLGGLLMDGGQ